MLLAVIGISLVAQLASILTRYGFRRSRPLLRRIIATLVAPFAAGTLTVTVARVSANQPFDAVGPEYGAIVFAGAVFVAIVNFAVVLIIDSRVTYPSATSE